MNLNLFKNSDCSVKKSLTNNRKQLLQTLVMTFVLLLSQSAAMSNTVDNKTELKDDSSNQAILTPRFSEGFDNITTLTASGWFLQNNSSPVGTIGWFQGNNAVFTAQSGAPTSYIGANFNSTAGAGTISNWLLTPTIAFNNGDQIRFYSRTSSSNLYPDRLEVRLSTNNTSTNVGTTATSVGDFTTLLLTINPTLVNNVYPRTWTQFTVTISGLPAATNGRVGFRYFVTNGGPDGANSDFIGIDTFQYIPNGTTAASVAVSGRVTTPAGRGIVGTRVTLTSPNGESKTAVTGAFGYYRFTEIPAGETYTFNVSAKRFTFTQNTQVRSIAGETDDINFVADN